MAKGQQQGLTSITVWMIVFVGLWLASTVFLVILYTGQEKLKQETTQAIDAKDRLISSSESRSIELFQAAHKGGPTLAGLLESARSDTAELATGEPSDDPAAIEEKLDQLLRTIRSENLVSDAGRFEDVSYHQGLDTLYQLFRTQKGLLTDAEARTKELQGEVDRLVESNANQKNELDKRAKELGDQLAEAEASRVQYRTDRDEQIADIRRGFDETNSQSDAELTRERQHSAGLEDKVEVLQERFVSMQKKLGELTIGPEELSTARRADGKVLIAIPGDDVVYIDLGREDSLTLGLKFAIYSAEMGIPSDGRSKAQVEVASISESSAECKILSAIPHRPILEGDLVANPVYDPNRPLRFLILGEFDLNHDGVSDRDGAATIEAMVEDWGGEPVTELSALTDFVVVGRAPRRPRTGTDASNERAQRTQAMQRLFDRYNETVATARSLAVPIMTQEVFLNFLGFGGRQARR